MPDYDVFISYRHSPTNAVTVEALAEALEARNLRVWLDQQQIGPFREISVAMHEGVSKSRALLAYYCDEYPDRRACQWELTAALLAGAHETHAEGINGYGRLMVVTPTATTAHLRPRALNGVMITSALQPMANLADVIATHVNRIAATTIGGVRQAKPTRWVGLQANASFQRFVGRLREMWDIFDALSGDVVFLQGKAAAPPKGGLGTARLHSWGGVGKSVLAAEYARRYAPFYPGGIFWLQASRATEAWHEPLRAALRVVAARLGVNLAAFDELPKNFPDPDTAVAEAREMVGRVLAADGKPYLWIVDAMTEGALASELEAWLAPDSQNLGRTLITTRDGALASVGTAITVDMLAGDEAYELLTFSREPADPTEIAAAQAFLEVVNRYPLAVDVAGQLVATGYFPSYAVLLQVAKNPEQDTRILQVEAGLRLDLPNGVEANIVATLLCSFDFVAAQTAGALALDVLRLAAVLAPQHPIPHEVLIGIFPGTALGTLEDIFKTSLATAYRHLSLAALISTSEQGITVHPVICRAMALSSTTEKMAELKVKAVDVLCRMMAKAGDIAQHAELAPLVLHVEALTRAVATEGEAQLVGWLGAYHHVAGRNSAAASYFDQELQALKALLHADDPRTLSAMTNCAGALLAHGNTSTAKSLFEQVYEAHHRVLGDNHLETLLSITRLASALKAEGNYAGARAMQERVLSTLQPLLGEDDPIVLTVMNNLGDTFTELGLYAEARTIMERVVAARRTALGDEHPQTLISVGNLARVLGHQADYGAARALEEQTLAVRLRTHGEDHPDTQQNMLNLGETLRAQGEYARARRLQERVVELREQALGTDHPHTLAALHNLLSTVGMQGKYDEIQNKQEMILESRRRQLGEDHQQTLHTMNNLALTLAKQGKFAEACALDEKVLAARKRVLGDDHPETLASMNNLAISLCDLGEPEKALLMHEEVLKSKRRIYGEVHPAVLTCEMNVALTHRSLGDFRTALELLNKAKGMAQLLPQGIPEVHDLDKAISFVSWVCEMLDKNPNLSATWKHNELHIGIIDDNCADADTPH